MLWVFTRSASIFVLIPPWKHIVVLLISTHNMHLHGEIRKLLCRYSLLSGAVVVQHSTYLIMICKCNNTWSCSLAWIICYYICLSLLSKWKKKHFQPLWCLSKHTHTRIQKKTNKKNQLTNYNKCSQIFWWNGICKQCRHKSDCSSRSTGAVWLGSTLFAILLSTCILRNHCIKSKIWAKRYRI